MALTTGEKDVIGRFLERYNEYHSSTFAVTSWPDELDRTGKAIDAIAEDSQFRLGIEHTLLQPFSGEKQDSNVFAQTVGQLDQKPNLVLPSNDVDLTIMVGAIPKGFDWSKVAPAVESWYLANRHSIVEGRSIHRIPNLPIPLDVAVNKVRSSGKGHFFVQRCMLPETVVPVVEQALKTKVPKLVAAQVSRRVLLLEKASSPRGYGEIGQAIETLRGKYPDVAQVDEVWVINTVSLKTENYTPSYAIWPRIAAQNFNVWRHSA
jgi:hypothetical protein